jgi:hypothetical protein
VRWIDARELQQWGERDDARTDLAGIVADLIRASAKDITSFRFASRDSGQLPGWDGTLENSEGKSERDHEAAGGTFTN